MSDPYLAEIRVVSFSYAPKGWALCNGQLLPINQNQALFSLLGTTYGGNGQTTFALPDFRGRVPLHYGNSWTLGQSAGQEFHTITLSEMPTHTHLLRASSAPADTRVPTNNYWASMSGAYSSGAANTLMRTTDIGSTGGSQPHENRMPFLTLTFIIALQGIFPSRS